MLLTGWSLATRRAELCDLTLGDIEFVGDAAKVTIQQSKTNPEPVVMQLSGNPNGAAFVHPVWVLRSWCDELRSAGAGPDTPLFQSLTRRGELNVSTATAITPQAWSDRIRELASEAGLFAGHPELLAAVRGHSLRRGWITHAILENRLTLIQISKHTRHASIGMLSLYADSLRVMQGTDYSMLLHGAETVAS